MEGCWTAANEQFAYFTWKDGRAAFYGGTWEENGGELSLDLEMYSGNDYDESITQTLAGNYHAVIDADGWLTLHLLDGDAMTQYMEDCGLDFFEPSVSYG